VALCVDVGLVVFVVMLFFCVLCVRVGGVFCCVFVLVWVLAVLWC